MRLSFIIFECTQELPGSSLLVPTPSACSRDESLWATMGMGCGMRSCPQGMDEQGGGMSELLLNQVLCLSTMSPALIGAIKGWAAGGRGFIEASTLEIHRHWGC